MFRSILSRFVSRSQKKAPRRQPKRLGSESLERRELMTVTYQGGAVMPHVEAQAVYLGQDWYNNASLYNQAGQTDGFLKSIVSGSYMDMLTGAGYGVGRGTADQGRISLENINKNYFLTDSHIRSDLQTMVSNGSLRTPDANRLFVVYVEPGVAIQNEHDNYSTSQKNFLGYHGAFAGHDKYGRFADIHYAVIAYPGGWNPTAARDGFRTNFDQLTAVTSHELAEAVTDPNVNYRALGWYDNQRGEIGDVVAGQEVTLNGYCVQKESNRYDQGMTPNGASPYSANSSFASANSAPSALSSQLAAGTTAATPAAVNAAFGHGLADTLANSRSGS